MHSHDTLTCRHGQEQNALNSDQPAGASMSLNELTAAVEADMMKNSITSTRNGFNLLALQVCAPHAHPAYIHTLHCILSPARLQFGFIVMFAVAWELGPLLMILTNIFQAPCPMPHPRAVLQAWGATLRPLPLS